MPDLDRLSAHYSSRRFTVLGVAADEPAEVQAFLTKLTVHYPIAVGDPDQVFAWSARLGNQSEGLPFSILLDKTGNIRWTKVGGRISVTELSTVIDKLLAEGTTRSK
jgi:peroxiredoxin